MTGPHCPACGAPAAPEARFCRACGAPFGPAVVPGEGVSAPRQAFSIKQAIGFGWRTTLANFPLLIGVSLLYLTISLTLRVGLRDVGGAGTAFIVSILTLAVEGVLSVGLITICLKLYDGQRPSLRDLAPPSSVVVRYLVVGAAFGLMVFAGLLLVVVPGIFLALTFGYAPLLVVDRGLGFGEAFRASARLTAGVKWRLLGLTLALAGVVVLGVLCLIVGVIVAFPVVQLATVFVYRRLLARAGV